MYKKNYQVSLFGFDMTNATLSEDNFWIKLSSEIDWDKLEDKYAEHFSFSGPVAINSRVAIGSLVIKSILDISDDKTVQLISENPYLQYFIGLNSFVSKAPFSPSAMSKFRTRIDSDDVKEIISISKKINYSRGKK